jgi:hypothetical protein
MLGDILINFSGLALLSGCATEPTTYPNFTAAPVAQCTSTSAFKQKTDAIFVILDASSSTNAVQTAARTKACNSGSKVNISRDSFV